MTAARGLFNSLGQLVDNLLAGQKLMFCLSQPLRLAQIYGMGGPHERIL